MITDGLNKKKWNIHEIHIISWLIKDVFWTLSLTWPATIMVIPTIFLAGYVLITDKINRDINLVLFSWLMLNVSWMLHELQNFPYWPVPCFVFLGFFFILRFIRNKNS